MLALPVVDNARKMLGIVTIDDVVKVIKQEQAEDIQKMGAVAPTEESYFKTEFWTLVKKRAGWLIAIFMGEILTASVLEHYETARRAFQAIEVFVPLIISSGGNTGSQASSLVIRGMALEEFSSGRRACKILWREPPDGPRAGPDPRHDRAPARHPRRAQRPRRHGGRRRALAHRLRDLWLGRGLGPAAPHGSASASIPPSLQDRSSRRSSTSSGS